MSYGLVLTCLSRLCGLTKELLKALQGLLRVLEAQRLSKVGVFLDLRKLFLRGLVLGGMRALASG